jgi:Fe-Mn family superoxide dismutase
MELHHKNHHQTYVNSYNAASEQLQAAESKQDIAAAIALQPLINFHGGGHLNHTLFWENLAPKNQGGGGEPEGKLKVRITSPNIHLLQVLMTPCRQQLRRPTAPSPISKASSMPH